MDGSTVRRVVCVQFLPYLLRPENVNHASHRDSLLHYLLKKNQLKLSFLAMLAELGTLLYARAVVESERHLELPPWFPMRALCRDLGYVAYGLNSLTKPWILPYDHGRRF